MLTKKEPAKTAKTEKNDACGCATTSTKANQVCETTQKYDAQSHTASTSATSKNARIIVKYDCGFKNQLYIRGQGGGLRWDKGTPLKCVKADEWILESDQNSAAFEFKVLINDAIYEHGNNHHYDGKNCVSYTPRF